MGGEEGGGGDGGFSQRQQAEEDRRTALRTRINQLYGIDDPAAVQREPTREQFTTGATPEQQAVQPRDDTAGGGAMVAGTPYRPANPGTFDRAAFDAAMAAFRSSDPSDPTARAARTQMTSEENRLSDAGRTFWQEDLRHTYDRAARNNRFALADRGLLGGSAQIDTEAELGRDNTLGATRVEDEVRAAVAGLRNQRESERLNATGLVAAGAGEDAVRGAQAGLTRAVENANAVRRTGIAGDLFTQGADQVAAGQNANAGALGYQQYLNSLRRFSGGGVNSGRANITPTT